MVRFVSMGRFVGTAMVVAAVAGSASGQPGYRVVDLRDAAASLGVVQCEARAVSDGGVAVGFELLADFDARAIQWDASQQATLLRRLAGDNSNYALGITREGTPLGISSLVTVEQVGQLTIVREDQKAVTWDETGAVSIQAGLIDPTEIVLQEAWDSTGGAMVGWGAVPGGGGLAMEPHGWLVAGGVATDLGALRRPVAMNSGGLVVGATALSFTHAMTWENGATTDLHLHPDLRGLRSLAWGVNDAGVVVGEAQWEIFKPEEPTVWRGGVPARLFPGIARPQGVAFDVNSGGDIVGFVIDLDQLSSHPRGFLATESGTYFLDELAGPGWQDMYPWDINDKGVIVGGGIRNGELGHGFVMIPECSADCDVSTGLLTLDFFDFICFQDRFGVGDPYACDCDTSSGPGVCDFFDFICFQDLFAAGC